ncbi:hypothetical protein BJ912DRAFT_601392, partial [Pholiota molesta]
MDFQTLPYPKAIFFLPFFICISSSFLGIDFCTSYMDIFLMIRIPFHIPVSAIRKYTMGTTLASNATQTYMRREDHSRTKWADATKIVRQIVCS